MKRAPTAFWLACWLSLALGCARAAPDEREATDASAWLEATRAAHQRADAALETGDAAAARAALTAALQRPLPAALHAEDARVVQQDLLFRLSQLALAEHATDEALRLAERGLALGREEDVFSASLLAARGHALAALGRAVEAADSYQEALAIDERLLRAALGAGATP